MLTGDGLLVVDVDSRNGGDDSYEDLCRKYGPFPDTWTVLCRDGGSHLYLSYPKELHIRSNFGLLPGIDVKAAGGYVIGPGSIHETGWLYQWELSSGPDDTAIALAPEWLLELLIRPQRKAATSLDGNGSTSKATIQREDSAHLPQVIPDGTRHKFLFSEGIYYRHLWMSPDRVRFILLSLNSQRCKPPLEYEDLEKLLEQVFKAKVRPTRKPGLSKDAKRILSWFRGQLRPGQPITIAKHVISAATGISERHIPRCINALLEHGVIEVEGTKGKANTYKLISSPLKLTHDRGVTGVYSLLLPLRNHNPLSVHPWSGQYDVLCLGRKSLPPPLDSN